jgi:hypothetical protein
MNADDSHPRSRDPRPPPPRRYRVIQRVEGPVLHALGMSCREFARLTVARIDRTLTTGESLRHRFHGAMCGVCTRFSAQFSALGELTREIESETAPASENPPDHAAITRVNASVRAALDDGRR